jgi:hypothetical protein
MSGRVREVVHDNPVWRDRSDFIIAAEIPNGGEIKTEQLWAHQLDETRFEICCIPFFVYDLALGDIVETDASYLIRRVLQPSGRYTFRVWFGDSFHPRDPIVDQLVELGALTEWSSRNLLGVDASDDNRAQLVANFLAEREASGVLRYETGRT